MKSILLLLFLVLVSTSYIMSFTLAPHSSSLFQKSVSQSSARLYCEGEILDLSEENLKSHKIKSLQEKIAKVTENIQSVKQEQKNIQEGMNLKLLILLQY